MEHLFYDRSGAQTNTTYKQTRIVKIRAQGGQRSAKMALNIFSLGTAKSTFCLCVTLAPPLFFPFLDALRLLAPLPLPLTILRLHPAGLHSSAAALKSKRGYRLLNHLQHSPTIFVHIKAIPGHLIKSSAEREYKSTMKIGNNKKDYRKTPRLLFSSFRFLEKNG